MNRIKEINEQIHALEQERDQLLIATAQFQPGDVLCWQVRQNGPVLRGRVESIRPFSPSNYEYIVYQIHEDGTEADFTTAISYSSEVWREG